MYIICTAEVMSSKARRQDAFKWRRVSVDFNPTLCYFFSWGGGQEKIQPQLFLNVMKKRSDNNKKNVKRRVFG